MHQKDIKLLTVPELAEILHMTAATIRNRLSRGEPMPPSIKVGHRRLFPERELNDWIMSKIDSIES
ncbi:putative transcriptional regulator [Methylophaga frappieri]|uniref:Putative transcriptional regulator n=1 Tax=Methylophaga frappieri (strain ATCC BAA-2434 / DSM 25690 / JAM7) TaxID=754477 RepID=I1YI25_METFJ|nr:helix-turn-helix domain-containing protein [Methylophaga frappieri]AFJ02568.1 putative transcriptional regulator [Methylophaga frappieri]